jgi:hypothetical protein
LKSGDLSPLTDLLLDKMRAGLLDRFKKAEAAKAFKVEDLEAGREYIEAYVTFIHYVEGLYEAAANTASGHYPEGQAMPHEAK